MISKLTDMQPDNTQFFGAKAAALGLLARNGFTVPEGYAISCQDYDAYLKYNQFAYSPEMYLAHNPEIQDFIMQGEFPPDTKTKLNAVFAQLTDSGQTSLAVRSSATCEDRQDFSMAGVFESYINIVAYDEFEKSIRKCYASLFSDKAIAIYLRTGIDLGRIGMGVVIQKFIIGDISGVMFTADPINQNAATAVISAVAGLCSAFVDGTRPSSRYSFNKHSREIIDCRKTTQSPDVHSDILNQLIDSAQKIETVFGSPQDVEWSVAGDKLHILQARPITAFRNEAPKLSWALPDTELAKHWYLYFPNPCKPLAEDLLSMLDQGKCRGIQESGKGSAFDIRIVNGYAYYQIGLRDQERRDQFRARLDRLAAEGKNIYQDWILPQLQQSRLALEQFTGRLLPVNELQDYICQSIGLYQQARYLHVLAVDGYAFLDEFKMICHSLLPEITDNDFCDLVHQQSILAEERERILDLAQKVRHNVKLTALFNNCLYDEILYARLNLIEPGVQLLQMINGYLDKYGLMSRQGFGQIFAPVLREKPWEVLGKIRACLGLDYDAHQESLQKIRQNKQVILTRIMDRLGPPASDDFMVKLAAAEKAFLVNDDHCFNIDLTSQGPLRLALLAAGNVLVEQGRLESNEDIYFLDLTEIFRSLSGAEVDSALLTRELIKVRKTRYQLLLQLNPPEFLGKAPDDGFPGSQNATNQHETAFDQLKGESGLGRRVTGSVRVLTDPTKSQEIQDDCILVMQHGHGCYFLPIIDRIKGLIYDEGSPFDHPGILAREFAIPSLYKTKHATRVLKDGDFIELDGIEGVIRIMKRKDKA